MAQSYIPLNQTDSRTLSNAYTFQTVTDGTFHSAMTGTFQSDTGGTSIPLLSNNSIQSESLQGYDLSWFFLSSAHLSQ